MEESEQDWHVVNANQKFFVANSFGPFSMMLQVIWLLQDFSVEITQTSLLHFSTDTVHRAVPQTMDEVIVYLITLLVVKIPAGRCTGT